MDETTDPLGGEISVEIKLDEKGVKAGAKSRAIIALDRLCGNLIDLPGGFIEGKAKRQRIRNQVREELLIAEGQAALNKISGDSRFGQRVIENFAEDLLRRQDNKDDIAALAIEDLRHNADSETIEDGKIDDDWMNVFSSHAENASSEHLQRMWSKVLSGEIRKPGSFSLSTLRFISELDIDIATKFQTVIRDRFGGLFLLKPDVMEGASLLDAVFLEEVGLLQQVTGLGGLSMSYTYNPDGSYLFRERNMLLVMDGPPGTKINVDVIKITRTGQEIANILPAESPQIILRSIAGKFTDTANSIKLALITHLLDDGQVTYQIVDRIK
jgi:hypothetical protein